jgi:hypothetical protein
VWFVKVSQSEQSYIYTFILFFGVVGLMSPYKYNVAPIVLVFDLFLVLFLVAFLFRSSAIPFKGALYIIITALYLLASIVIASIRGVNPFDFLQAYKAFIYLFMISFFLGSSGGIFSIEKVKIFFYALLFLFLLKYLYSRGLSLTPRMGERPGIFVENNFELIFLVLLYYLVHPVLRNKFLLFIALSFVVFISGSRSAVLSLFVVYFFVFFKRFDWRLFTLALAFIPFAYMSFSIFLSRMDGGIESIDRFRFMLFFIYEVSDWPWWKFLFGEMPITPLSKTTCEALSFYNSLYSFSGDGSCYSVILHSYFFRVIFDHGIIGLAFLSFFVIYALSVRGYAIRHPLCVLGVLFTSALSVSSFNSVFAALSLLFFIGINKYDCEKYFS